MKYLGPFVLGATITVGLLVAVQMNVVDPPVSTAPSVEPPLDPVLLAGELTVPTRSIPAKIVEAPDTPAAVRQIGLPPTPPAEDVPAEATSEPVPEPSGSDEDVSPAPVETAGITPVDEPVAAAADRVAGGFEAAPEAPASLSDAMASLIAAREDGTAAEPDAVDPIGALVAAGTDVAALDTDPGAIAAMTGAGEAAEPAIVPTPEPPVVEETAAPEPEPQVAEPVVEETAAPEPEPQVAEPVTVAALAPAAPATAEDGPDAMNFVEVSVLDGGRLRGIRQAKPVIVRIADVEALPFAERCGTSGPGGVGWPCGARARAELARLIGRRPVECRVKADVTGRATVQEVVASCSVDGSDLSLWVARNGWAEPASGGGFAIQEANRLAQKEAKGRYAPEPPAVN